MKYKFGYWEHEYGLRPFFDKLGNDYFDPIIDYFVMLEYHYLTYKLHNNIDAWLFEIDKQLLTNSNEEFFGDNVCVFFKDDKVKLINYWDYESGKENYCELTVLELKKMTVEWKWFVIDWEIKVIKGEI